MPTDPWWWPLYVPFGAPSPSAVGALQPSTTTSRPSTTSPWWVPDPTTTTERPGTTSPWWVAVQSTTTPSTTVTTSTQKPSTTSPWWVADQSTTTPSTTVTTFTEKPSTTSPWWVPESTTSTTGKPSVEPVIAESESTGICGRGPKKTLSLDEQRRIVGGTTALRNSWPFIVIQFCFRFVLKTLS